MRASHCASVASKLASKAKINFTRSASPDSERGCITGVHTSANHWRAKEAWPCSDIRREAACTATSGMARSLASRVSQTLCSLSGSWAPLSNSMARPRTMLCAAGAEKARCLASKRAVSMANSVWPAKRAARKRRRKASVRRPAPTGNLASHSSAIKGSRSSSAQRTARS